jgi:hypothetical protein
MYCVKIYIDKKLVSAVHFRSYEHALGEVVNKDSSIYDDTGDFIENHDIDLRRPFIFTGSIDNTGFNADLEFRYAGGQMVVLIEKPIIYDDLKKGEETK